MKRIIAVMMLFLLVGCQQDTNEPNESIEPALYKYYIDPSYDLRTNIEMSLDKAEITDEAYEMITIDEASNVIVIIKAGNQLSSIGHLAIDNEKLSDVAFDMDAYLTEFKRDAITDVEEVVEEGVYVLVCNEAEGIPTTAIWYEQAGEKIQFILSADGVDDTEGKINN